MANNEVALWLDEKLASPLAAKSTKNRLSKIPRYSNAAVGTIWTLPLSYTFGLLVAKLVLLESQNARRTMGYSIALISGVSSLFLFARLTQLIFRRFSRPSLQADGLINRPEKNNFKTLTIGLLFIGAAITSSPSTYETYHEFNELPLVWRLTITAATFINLWIKNAWAMMNVITSTTRLYKLKKGQQVHNRSAEDPEGKRVLIQAQLKAMYYAVVNMPEKELDKINLTAAPLASLTYSYTFSRAQKSTTEEVFGFVGGLIGICGAWYAYPLGRKGGVTLLNAMSVPIKAARYTATAIGALAWIFNASLLAYTTRDSFLKFSRLLIKSVSNAMRKNNMPHNDKEEVKSLVESSKLRSIERPNINLALSCCAFVVALCGGGPMTVMTYQQIDQTAFYATFIIGSAFIGMFSSKFWAMKGTIDGSLSSDKRTKLNKTLNELQRLLPYIKEECLDELGVITNTFTPLVGC